METWRLAVMWYKDVGVGGVWYSVLAVDTKRDSEPNDFNMSC